MIKQAAVYICLFFLGLGTTESQLSAKILGEMTEETNKRSVSSPVRAGKVAYKHQITNTGERDEFEFRKTDLHGTYWLGHSYFLPEDFPEGEGKNGFTLISQYAAYPSANKWPCRGVGSHLLLGSGEGRGQAGKMTFVLQSKAGDAPVKCTQHVIADIKDMKNKWTDIVMHVKWTGNPDGFLKLWLRFGNGNWVQKLDIKGATFANNEGNGPYFKMGAYVGNPGNGSRLLYTDEYRLGDSTSSFEEIAPGGKSTQPPTTTPVQISLSAGWNLFSLPVEVQSKAIGDVLSGITGKFSAIYGFANNSYSSYIPGDPANTLREISPGKGYWIYMDEAATLNVTGTEAGKTTNLEEGWNLVGLSSRSPQVITSALSSLRGKYEAVYSFNPKENRYLAHFPDGESEFTQLEPGGGYWIYVNEKATWTIS
jgi:hypothetical protein